MHGHFHRVFLFERLDEILPDAAVDEALQKALAALADESQYVLAGVPRAYLIRRWGEEAYTHGTDYIPIAHHTLPEPQRAFLTARLGE